MPDSPDPYEVAADGMTDEQLGIAPRWRPYSRVKRGNVAWLWYGRLPCGKLVMLDGDPDVGKSTVIVDIAARLTTCSPLPDGYLPAAPTNVLILRGEDSAEDTVLPRLHAAGGDPERFIEFEAVPELDDTGRIAWRAPELPTDLHWLEQLILAQRIGLVIVDVLAAFMAGHVNMHHDQDVRRALSPMADVAARTGACVVSLRHLNKTPGLPGLYRGGGSIGIIGAARVGLVCGPDPRDPRQRLLGVAKCNVAKKEPTLAYKLVPNDLYDCAQVEWHGASDTSASEMLHLNYDDDDDRSDTDHAVAMLFDLLRDGPVPANDVKREAAAMLVPERALKRAAKLVGVLYERKGGKPAWRLPDPERFFDNGDGTYGEGPAA